MSKPNFDALDARELYDLYNEVVDEDFMADSVSPQWECRLVSGVEYANDVASRVLRRGDEVDYDAWAEIVRAIADND